MTGKEPDAADTKTASEPDLLHVNRLIEGQELADYLGVPYGTLNAWATRGGSGPDFVKVGVHRKYRPEAVRAWLDAGTNVKRPRSVA